MQKTGWSSLPASARVSRAARAAWLPVLLFTLACAGLPVGGEEAALDPDAALIEETPSPWSFGLVFSMLALFLGGFSAVLGIWVDRDKSRPITFAAAMSVLIISAISVGMIQSYLDAVGAIEDKADLDRMLTMVNEIGAQTGDPEIAELVRSEGGTPLPKVEQPVEEVVEEELVEGGEVLEGGEAVEGEEAVEAAGLEGEAAPEEAPVDGEATPPADGAEQPPSQP
jgi:hypothetical protein